MAVVIVSLLFLGCSTELHELLRLPLLVDHYRAHRANTRSLSFFSFLKIHYTSNHPADQDEQQDNELPFKTVDQLNHLDKTVVFKNEIFTGPAVLIAEKLTGFFSERVPTKWRDRIFHPPQCS